MTAVDTSIEAPDRPLGGLRIAVAGKGGAGKTTISATLSRLLARRGHRVLVVDGDSNPNVAVALGVDRERAAAIPPLPPGLVSRRLDGPALVDPVSSVVERFGAEAPDGVSVVHMAMPAHADEGCLCSAHATVSGILADAGRSGPAVTLLDLEASPENFSRGTTRHVDALLLVVEPYYRSLETARRMGALAAELPIPHVEVVANKLRSPGDIEAIAEFFSNHELEVAALVPWGDAVLDADKEGVPLLDFDPDGPVVAAVSGLADRLLARHS
ncbi:MAG: AAA family ATPase [Actinomycetota bacterium]|nr:AAA family ATPase [Actinomycetota bacterium]